MDGSRRRLSPVRIVILLLVVAGLVSASWSLASQAYRRIAADPATTWFAPYVDVTLTPTFAFEDPVASPPRNAVLGFVVADRRHPCSPTWGTYYDLEGAGRVLDLDRRIVRLRERGGDAIVSFGGAANRELAVACTDPAALLAAYRSVIERYDARTVDFDIEGTALSDTASVVRRARALKSLQSAAAASGHPLNVWLTLPVSPAGMPPAAVAAVDATLRAGVDLAGVNVMTMDFGASRAGGQSMSAAVEQALRATWTQIGDAYRRAGHTPTAAQVWARIGATPMIGRNDTPSDVFTLDSARALVGFANGVRLGRMSMWSANRDTGCGVQTDDERVSNTCSGVPQGPLAFGWELSRLDGALPARPAPAGESGALPTASRDDPRLSPYPIWRPSKAYSQGDKVVWHSSVYVAKWWTQGDRPDQAVDKLWNTPWRYVGPVLPTDSGPRPPGVPGEQPRWTIDQVYLKGDRVSHDGFVYEAKWWTQGDEPQPDPDRPADAAWSLVGRAGPESQRVYVDYSPWQRKRTYPTGARVSYRSTAYEARRWTTGVLPDPDPATPDAAPWAVLGMIATSPKT